MEEDYRKDLLFVNVLACLCVDMLHYGYVMVDKGMEIKPDVRSGSLETPSSEQTPGEADRKAYEELPETKDAFLEQEPVVTGESRTGEKASLASSSSQASSSSPVLIVKDETTIRVEKIMEEGLGNFYSSLPEDAKPAFKAKGEEIATEIAGMMKDVKLRISRVIRLLREWLMTIPKANKFFLEQEAKIKADKIVELFQAQHEETNKQP